MEVDPNDFMDCSFYLGSYEPHLVRLIANVVCNGDVCVDIGAHKGYITLHLASAVGGEGRVIAIEPDLRAMAALKSNVPANGLSNVRFYGCAVADGAGPCAFMLSSQLGLVNEVSQRGGEGYSNVESPG